MPLESNSSDSYDIPSSTPDRYDSSYSSSNVSANLPAHIPLDSLPHGLPILGPLTGYTPNHLAHTIHQRYASLSQSLSRPLTEKELTAIAYHTSKGMAIASYGPTLGIGAAFYRIRATREEFRLPFYGKLKSEELGKGFWDGEKMRVGGKEVLKNLPASTKALIIHAIRGTAYVSIGMFIAPAMVSAYGATVGAVGELRDPRMAELTRELRVAANQELRERNDRRGEARGEAVGRATGQGQKDMGSVFRERSERMKGRRQQEKSDDDDMSPTGGSFMSDDIYGVDEEEGRLSGAGDMGGVLSDGQMRSREVQAQPEAKKSPTENRASTFEMGKVARQPKNFGDDYFDDASPSSGSGEEAGGSVWERIRQQQASGSVPPSSPPPSRSMPSRKATSREQQAGSTLGDSFSFSSSEEERTYAKDEAQKEFDQRVERERKGGDFSEGRGGGWRR